jgi:hypothetical protein
MRSGRMVGRGEADFIALCAPTNDVPRDSFDAIAHMLRSVQQQVELAAEEHHFLMVAPGRVEDFTNPLKWFGLAADKFSEAQNAMRGAVFRLRRMGCERVSRDARAGAGIGVAGRPNQCWSFSADVIDAGRV